MEVWNRTTIDYCLLRTVICIQRDTDNIQFIGFTFVPGLIFHNNASGRRVNSVGQGDAKTWTSQQSDLEFPPKQWEIWGSNVGSQTNGWYICWILTEVCGSLHRYEGSN